MHSFHYLYPHSKFLTKHPEKYARNVGQELEKLNLSHAIVKESPEYRNYNKLTERYNAKWVLDLHSNDAKVEYPKWVREIRKKGNLAKGPKYLLMMYVGGKIPQTEQMFPNSYYLLTKFLREEYPKEHFDVDIPMRDRPENYIGVELFHNNPKSKSVEFVKKLVEFLYLN